MHCEKVSRNLNFISFIFIIVFLLNLNMTTLNGFAAENTTISINMPAGMKYATPAGAADEKVYVKKTGGIDIKGSFTLKTGTDLSALNAGIYLFVNKDGDYNKDSFTAEKLSEGIKLPQQNINYHAKTFNFTVTEGIYVNSWPNRVFAVICDNDGNIEGTGTYYICIDTQNITFDASYTANSVSIKVNETISGINWDSVEFSVNGSPVKNYAVNDFEKIISYTLPGIGNAAHNYSIICKDNAGYEYSKTWQYPANQNNSSGHAGTVITRAEAAEVTDKLITMFGI